ncbi:MAG: arginase, partial [Bacteroidota bacterium]
SSLIHFTANTKNDKTEYFINKIIKNRKNYLDNFSVIGYQQYLNNEKDVDIMKKLFFNPVRLGQARMDLLDIEPTIRDSDIFAIDISSIRQSDAPAQKDPSPSGFFGEEVCQLSKYAGLSEKCKIFGLFNLYPAIDFQGISSNLSAQIVWYFLNGFYNRKIEHPENINKNNFLKFTVQLEEVVRGITFYKNIITEKWWMETPSDTNNNINVIACNYKDYNNAKNGIIPERWWSAQKKMN